MSLINASWNGANRWVVYCSACGCEVGELTSMEVGELSCASVDVKCFKCDPVGVDGPPCHTYFYDDEFLLVIGGTPFYCWWVTDTVDGGTKDIEARRVSPMAWRDLRDGRVRYAVSPLGGGRGESGGRL